MRGAITIGAGTTVMGFCSEGKRLGPTLNKVWPRGNLQAQSRSRVVSVDGKSLRGSIKGKGALAKLT